MLENTKTSKINNYLELKFEGVTCPGCIKAISDQVNTIPDTQISEMSKNDGTTIISTSRSENLISNELIKFQGCCEDCQISLVSVKQVRTKNIEYSSESNNRFELMQKQYKVALERAIDGIEVACSEHCVCKITDINRLEESSEAPSFASVYNFSEYLEKYLKDDTSIIDFGSGTGHDVFKIASLVPNSEITGIDVTPEMVNFGNQKAKELNLENVSFMEGFDLSDLKDTSQDLIYLNNVFNLLPSKVDFLKQVNRVLKSGGHLLLADEFSKFSLPAELRDDSAFLCGGIAGAELREHIIKICEQESLKIIEFSKINDYDIEYNSKQYQMETGILVLVK